MLDRKPEKVSLILVSCLCKDKSDTTELSMSTFVKLKSETDQHLCFM